jgi:thiol-disulfide isomerase/thioredoxin
MRSRSIAGDAFVTWTAQVVEAILVLSCLAGVCWLSAHQSVLSRKPVDPKSLVGNSAPQFVVTTLNGKVVSLGDYRGRAIIANFWATWCGNCKVEMPWLAKLRDKYSAQGLEVLGVVTDNAPPERILALTHTYSGHYPILICNHATAQAYGGLPDLPASFFIDRHGKIVAEMEGADSKEQIETNIRRALE